MLNAREQLVHALPSRLYHSVCHAHDGFKTAADRAGVAGYLLAEVCGDITLFTDEYGDEIRSKTYYLDYTAYDAVLSAEGEQYEYFEERGVTCSSDPNNALSLEYGGADASWWYRTAFPMSGLDYESSYFYQVMSSGYPCTIAIPDSEAGVVVGLCL